MERDYPVSSRHHSGDIKMAVNFARSRVNEFTMPERVVPAFPITGEEIGYLENCVRENLRKNSNRSGVAEDEGFNNFFEHAVRFGLNSILSHGLFYQCR